MFFEKKKDNVYLQIQFTYPKTPFLYLLGTIFIYKVNYI